MRDRTASHVRGKSDGLVVRSAATQIAFVWRGSVPVLFNYSFISESHLFIALLDYIRDSGFLMDIYYSDLSH